MKQDVKDLIAEWGISTAPEAVEVLRLSEEDEVQHQLKCWQDLISLHPESLVHGLNAMVGLSSAGEEWSSLVEDLWVWATGSLHGCPCFEQGGLREVSEEEVGYALLSQRAAKYFLSPEMYQAFGEENSSDLSLIFGNRWLDGCEEALLLEMWERCNHNWGLLSWGLGQFPENPAWHLENIPSLLILGPRVVNRLKSLGYDSLQISKGGLLTEYLHLSGITMHSGVDLRDQRKILKLHSEWARYCALKSVGRSSESDGPAKPYQVNWRKVQRWLGFLVERALSGEERENPYEESSKFLRREVWRKLHKRIPGELDVESLSVALIKQLKKPGHLKAFLGLVKEAKIEGHDSHTLIAAAKIVVNFGPQYVQWPELTTEGLFPGNIHRVGIDLPEVPSSEGVAWAWERRNQPAAAFKDLPEDDDELKEEKRKARIRALKGLRLILCSWEDFSNVCKERGIEPKKASVKEAEMILKTLTYGLVKDYNLAEEAARWKVSKPSYPAIEARWIKALAQKTENRVPAVRVVSGEYEFIRISDGDPTGLFAGKHTDCCQHPSGEGAECAWHSVESLDGCIFGVRKVGTTRLIAQSWAWRNGSVLVFDNIERLGEARDSLVIPMYEEAAEALLGKFEITEVRVGMGYNELDLSDYKSAKKLTKTPRGIYTDAGEEQRILAKKGDAE